MRFDEFIFIDLFCLKIKFGKNTIILRKGMNSKIYIPIGQKKKKKLTDLKIIYDLSMFLIFRFLFHKCYKTKFFLFNY